MYAFLFFYYFVTVHYTQLRLFCPLLIYAETEVFSLLCQFSQNLCQLPTIPHILIYHKICQSHLRNLMAVASPGYDQVLSSRFLQPCVQFFIMVVMSGIKVSLHTMQILRILYLTVFPERVSLYQGHIRFPHRSHIIPADCSHRCPYAPG